MTGGLPLRRLLPDLQNTADPTFMRLIQFGALEGHEFPDLFRNPRQRKDPASFQLHPPKIKEKAFKRVPPLLAARAFMA